MPLSRRMTAELFGTFWLVFGGCGAAVLSAAFPSMGIGLLGVALAFAWRALRDHRPTLTNPYPFMVAALAGVWTINFFVVLPIVSPGFIHMVPYTVSLTSKLLFGLAMAGTMRWQAALNVAPVLVRKCSD